MRPRAFAIAVLGLSAVLVTSPVRAQQVEVEKRAPAPETRIEVVPPGLHDEVSRPTDADFYSTPPRVQHDPAFIQPFATKTTTGHAGLSGWTAPQTPVGASVAGQRDQNGWLALGFSLTWGAPPPPKRPATR